MAPQGSEGSHKSSAFTPISGTIYIDGVPVNELRYNPVRREIGFVTQGPQLFSGTIRENLLYLLLEKKGLYYAMWRQQIGERDTRQFESTDGNLADDLEAQALIV